ncbi:MAG TPA: glycosyltransferase family 2 protein, partial [Oligoflexia bacterium]|nr:glycosyltransferase family 2 protein [Oligoflexia bacterium]
VLLKHRDNCRVRAGHVAEADMRQREHAGSLDDCLADHLCFLRSVFSGKLSSFERKRFDNLSHEPNKAMNLNSYIGIMGSAFRFEKKGEKELLVAAPMEYADLTVEESEYIVTLDADSIILPDYVLRLLYMMEQPGNERLAVIQTPYNAFPFAPGRLEQVAGATTDVQYIIHQGFTAFSGTYWVGANALLRKQALNDIAVCERERGYSVVRYIQDRTVIEDTESSIDLVARDWRLYNYPERLAFSATPPDFGALIIQRRRWANGGLIILPKLLRYLLCNAYHWRIWFEGFFRVHYLISIAAVNVGLLTVLALPFTESVRSWWLPLSALPYFVLYARDLRLSGYRRRDVFGVYAINLLLIPVNLAGVFKSIEQMLSKSKIPFGRTPKVNGRTAASPFYVAAVYFLFAQWLLGALVDVYYSRWLHAAFASVNAAFLAYAVVGFAGLRETWADLVVPLRAWRRDFRRRWVYPAGRRIGLPLRPRYLYAERGVD